LQRHSILDTAYLDIDLTNSDQHQDNTDDGDERSNGD
tara:strand:- start:164 stop:274 length:111 start_codon:yes stop_codon:yes gene_type:complete